MRTDDAFQNWIDGEGKIDWKNPKDVRKKFIQFGDYAIEKYLEYKGIRREIIYKGFDGDWKLVIDFNNQLTVTYNGQNRIYDLEYNISKIKNELDYVYLEIEGGGFYQFKFEIGSFFVGDLFDKDGTHMDSVACHVFDEE